MWRRFSAWLVILWSWLAAWGDSRRSRVRPSRPPYFLRRLIYGFEQLEGKALTAVLAGPDPADARTLQITSDSSSAAESVTVDVSATTIRVSGTGLATKNFPLSQFQAINVGFKGGNDFTQVIVREVARHDAAFARLAALRLNVWGGDGNDRTIFDIRSEAVDKVFADGGSGSDRVEIRGWMPRGMTTFATETSSLGRLAQAQKSLRDAGVPNLYRPLTAIPITSSSSNRSSALYRDTIDQFDVGFSHADRYRKGTASNNDTRCNIFAGDVATANGVYLPKKASDANMTAGASALHTWLKSDAGKQSWTEINPATSSGMQALLDALYAGRMAVASSPDHIAVIRPEQAYPVSPSNWQQLLVAQAGARNFSQGTMSYGFGSSIGNVRIFVSKS